MALFIQNHYVARFCVAPVAASDRLACLRSGMSFRRAVGHSRSTVLCCETELIRSAPDWPFYFQSRLILGCSGWDQLRDLEKASQRTVRSKKKKVAFIAEFGSIPCHQRYKTDNPSPGVPVKWRGDNISGISFDFRRKTSVSEHGAEA